MNDPAVSIKNLVFSYRERKVNVFDNLNIDVARGERFGLFGTNGAGKTTLMNCMTGLLSIREGSIRLFGHEITKNKDLVKSFFGLVPQELSFYHELNSIQNLEFFGAWSGMKKEEIGNRISELLEVLQLKDVSKRPVHQLSGGMKRRLNLAIGVMHRPDILFLDEPTVGVDIQTRHAIIDHLIELNKNGTTLIYTSHQLNEAEELCDKVALIDEGRIIAHDTLGNLLSEHKEDGLEGLFINLTGKAYKDPDV